MSTSISASIGNLMFPNLYFDSYTNSIFPTGLFTFCNANMTGEPVHTASKGRMAPEISCNHFTSRCVSQPSVIKLLYSEISSHFISPFSYHQVFDVKKAGYSTANSGKT